MVQGCGYVAHSVPGISNTCLSSDTLFYTQELWFGKFCTVKEQETYFSATYKWLCIAVR